LIQSASGRTGIKEEIFLRALTAALRQDDFVFIDEIKIYAQAEHGGKGCVAFQV
jgi:hypothetical protein